MHHSSSIHRTFLPFWYVGARYCLSFCYHRFIDDFGTIQVLIINHNGKRTVLWSLSESMGDVWLRQNLTFSLNNDERVRFVIGDHTLTVLLSGILNNLRRIDFSTKLMNYVNTSQ